MLYNLTFCRRT